MLLSDVLIYLIEKGPGRTEAQLAAAIYGSGAEQQRVNQDCRLLAGGGKVERRGEGGPGDPFRYYPATK
jgi:hypothetical protein